MVKLVNRAKVSTATTGTGTITLGSAVDGFQTFAAAGVANGDAVRYAIEDGNNWEIGTGTYNVSGPTLTRTVSESSNSGLAINLSGTALVFLTVAGEELQHAADMDQGVATTDSPTFAGTTLTGDLTIPDKITHTGDTNTAIRFPAADTVTVETAGSERVRVDSSGRVGIGTSSPIYALDVNSGTNDVVARFASADTNCFLDLRDGATTAGYVRVGAVGDEFVAWAGNSERMRIDSSGWVGIGTSSPTGLLTIGTNTPRLDFLEANGSSGFDNTILIRDADVFAIQTRNGGTFVSNDYRITANASGALTHEWRVGNSEKMRIDSSGRVGIGTSSPDRALTNAGNITSTKGTNPWYELVETDGTTTHNKVRLYLTGDDFLIQSRSDADAFVSNDYRIFRGASGPTAHVWYTGASSERMRIDSNGRLVVASAAPTTDGYIKVPVGSDTLGAWVSSSGSTANRLHMRFENPNGVVGSISTSASATAYSTSSDYRLKEDVQPMVGSVDRLMALKPVNFAWKVDGSRVDGFLAHEAQEVVPESVTGTKDQVEIVEVKDEDGNVSGIEERPVYQGIDQSKLVPLLTAALQEALTKIEALEVRVAALEA